MFEGAAHAVQHVNHRQRAVGPAEAQGGQPVDLREGAQHDDVVAGLDEGGGLRVVGRRDVLGIGGVDHQQPVVRQALVQAAERGLRTVAAGRVVRVGAVGGGGGGE